MTFETYFSTMSILEDLLSLEESLYVLTSLLNGFENIFKKMKKANNMFVLNQFIKEHKEILDLSVVTVTK